MYSGDSGVYVVCCSLGLPSGGRGLPVNLESFRH